MFHLKSIELVHWDYWQRFRQTLDANIVAIVGPNGSGKTTLLDALRTLFALPCAGKRDYKRYVRHANEPFAWLRAVVDNRRIGNARHPFFPLLEDEVTLVCRIRKQGGDWQRQYLIAPGDAPIDEAMERSPDWLGVRDYERRLASGGLTPAIAQVLALEQGETDRLCEYTPKALLDLVFHVFGDKRVLDDYMQARSDQREGEAELAQLDIDLARTDNEHQAFVQRANSFLQWRGLKNQEQALIAQIRPRLEVAELRQHMRNAETRLDNLRRQAAEQQARIAQEDRRRARNDIELDALADKQQAAAGARGEAAARQREALTRAAETRSLLKERERLREQAKAAGGDSAEAAARLEKKRPRLAATQAEIRLATQQHAEANARLAALKSGKPALEHYVAQLRGALDEAGIAHAMLTEIVEVSDAKWQAAVEALLAPYRHLVLLKRPRDREAAWRIGEKLQYRSFLTPDLEPPPAPAAGSMLEVLRFAGDVPAWLSAWLNRVQRVEDAAASAKLDTQQDWITRAGYHRERRGARFSGVAAADFRFGEAARRAQLAALQTQSDELRERLAQLAAGEKALLAAISRDQARVSGVDAANMLAARAEEFAAAEARLVSEEIQERDTNAAHDTALAAERSLSGDQGRLAGEKTQIANALREAQSALTVTQMQLQTQSDEQQKRIEREALLRSGMPADWLNEQALTQLLAQYESLQGVDFQLHQIKRQIEEGQWETDDTVIARRDKLAEDVAAKTKRVAESRMQCERARSITEDARGEYLNVLRATVRSYGRHLRELGLKAGIEVDYEMPHLTNDDVALAQAGLNVRFNFDQKGMIGLNDGEASGGQQVMKSLILLIALTLESERPGGFVFIDEPFAHLDVMNIDRVAAFLRATQAQYLITTPSTHNINVFSPVQLTLVTQKKRPHERWAPPLAMLRRDESAAQPA
ncbi:MAG: chromosome segregation protein SMC [Betaproteobacteria bacterium]|nr:chromosome segregation protein SMC [Betaproteobacteria bacterium]